jgi:hypothetical protein
MAVGSDEFAVEDLMFVVRALTRGADADASCDVLAISPEADALIVAAKRSLEHNEAACDSLDLARLLLSLGRVDNHPVGGC